MINRSNDFFVYTRGIRDCRILPRKKLLQLTKVVLPDHNITREQPELLSNYDLTRILGICFLRQIFKQDYVRLEDIRETKVGVDDNALIESPHRLTIPVLRPCIAVSFFSQSTEKGLLIHFLFDRDKFSTALTSAQNTFKGVDDLEIDVVGGNLHINNPGSPERAYILSNREFVEASLVGVNSSVIRINFDDDPIPHRLAITLDPVLGGLLVDKLFDFP
ncbi:MAG: hypothetical protein WCV91_01750 [Candidatus Margulisiibacteriota bacterium]